MCCTSMKKVCEILKKHILRRKEEVAPRLRDHDFDGMVVSNYRAFPHNAEACERITSPTWNPPTQVVRKWVALCSPEIWSHAGLTRVISLVPLDLNQIGQITAVLQSQVASIKTQLEQIAAVEQLW